jgi:hypothetical protein
VKKIIGGLVGVVVVVGLGVGLWFFLDSSAIAATVGKTKITESQVDGSIKQILAERQTVSTTGMQLASGDALSAQQLNFYIISSLLEQTVAANNLTVTTAQLATRTASIVKQQGSAAKLKSGEVSAGIAFVDFPSYVKEILYVEALSSFVEKQGTAVANSGMAVQGLVRAQAAKVGVTIKNNKKYGTWDPTHVTVIPPSTTTTTK